MIFHYFQTLANIINIFTNDITYTLSPSFLSLRTNFWQYSYNYREELRPRVFKNRILMQVIRKRMRNILFYLSPNTIRVMKSTRLRLAGHLARIECFQAGERHLEKSSLKWKDNIRK